MKYTQARELVEAALEIILNEMPQTKARAADMRNKIKRETKAYLGKPGGGRGLKSLLKQDAEEARSGTLYGRGGKKIKKASAVNEMAQTNARYRQMGDAIERATVAYNEGKPGAGRKWRNLLKQDEREARSATLYGRGGKKIKNPKKHRDSRPLGEESEDVLLEFDPKRGEDGRATPLASSFKDAKEKGLPGAKANEHKRTRSLSPHGRMRLHAYFAGRQYASGHAGSKEFDGDFKTGEAAGRSPDVGADLALQRDARYRRARRLRGLSK